MRTQPVPDPTTAVGRAMIAQKNVRVHMNRIMHQVGSPVVPPLVPVAVPPLLRLFDPGTAGGCVVEEVHVSHPQVRSVCTQCGSTVAVARTQQYHVGTTHHRMVCCDQCGQRKKAS